jgi:DMSO/TMAO reductase YedYZ molybdopterin-dependent catalytic subunit
MAIGDPPNYNSLLGALAIPDMWAHVNKDEAHAELMRQLAQAQTNHHMAQAQQAGVGQAASPYPPPAPPMLTPNTATLAVRARELFLKRMGGLRAELKVDKDDFLQCHIFNEQVYVFYCFGGRHGVTLEPIDLFPSDQLITQFRLVLT